MGAINLRKNEIDAIVALVGPREGELDGLHPDEQAEIQLAAQDLAKEVLKTAFDLMRMREWHVIVHRYGGDEFINFGLESTRARAEEWAGKYIGGGQVGIARIFPAGVHEEWVATEEAEWAAMVQPRCADCGHPEWAHKLVNWKGDAVPRPKGAKVWCSSDCRCKAFRFDAQAAA